MNASPRPAVLLLAGLALAGCAERPAARHVRALDDDPALVGALLSPILVDPDLAGQSHRYAVLSDPEPFEGSLPPDDFAPASVVAAREQAARLAVGGEDVARLPRFACDHCAAPTLAARAAALAQGCGQELEPGFAWGAQLAPAWPIYPRGHVREAAGTRAGPCPTIAVSFTAPVPAAEALGFYAALARRGGYALAVGASGHALRALKPGHAALLIARDAGNATSQVDLVVNASR